MFRLTEESRDDWWEVETLYDLCFAPGREMLSSYRLRDDVPKVAPLCLIAREALDEGYAPVAAAIRYWPVRVGVPDQWVRALLLGPVAVHPTRQGEGLGALLIQESMQRAAEQGWDRVMLVGDAPYYKRFGFTKLPDVMMPPPTNPERVLGHELVDGAWAGIAGNVMRDLD